MIQIAQNAELVLLIVGPPPDQRKSRMAKDATLYEQAKHR